MRHPSYPAVSRLCFGLALVLAAGCAGGNLEDLQVGDRGGNGADVAGDSSDDSAEGDTTSTDGRDDTSGGDDVSTADADEDPAARDLSGDDRGRPDTDEDLFATDVAADSSEPDAVLPDLGAPDEGGGEDTGPATCSVSTARRSLPRGLLPEGRPVRVVIEWIDFENEIVAFRNVTTREIAFDTSWEIFTQGSHRSLDGARVAAGERLLVHLTGNGRDNAENLYLNQTTLRIEPCGGEIAILRNASGGEWSNEPSYIQAFVMWGDRRPAGASATFNDEAVDANAWNERFGGDARYRVDTCYSGGFQSFCGADPPCEENDRGILWTGSLNDYAGWTGVLPGDAAGCFR